MPKSTFLNLEDNKRKLITDAFLREFAIKSFDDASITEVVKQLGIAKGSVYQYFDDKLDLFMYLIGECTAIKIRYTEAVKREQFPDYWAYFRELFEHGYRFDAENPLQSHFLHNLTQNLKSPSVKQLYDQLLQQVITAFEQMVIREVELGLFRNDIPTKTMGFLLYKVGTSVQEQLEATGAINPRESIHNNLPVYEGKKAILMETVDHYINMSRKAFDKESNQS